MDHYHAASDRFVAENGQGDTYGRRGLAGTDYHTHRFGSPAAYNGANLVLDLQTVIAALEPKHIFVTAEFDGHPDHAATYRVLRAAVTSLAASGHAPSAVIHKTVVHAQDKIWPPLRPDPRSLHTVMPRLDSTPLRWADRESLNVPAPMAVADLDDNLKYRALQAHASQAPSGRGFIGRFTRKDEVFWVENMLGNNQPPTANAGPDLAIGPMDTILLDGSGSRDPEGQPLHFQWRQTAGPPVTLSDAHATHPSFTAPSTGFFGGAELVFELIVGDGEFDTVPDSMKVAVAATKPRRRHLAAAVAVPALGLLLLFFFGARKRMRQGLRTRDQRELALRADDL
jgi:LmbE family N-acetylglucosaminyl deacetylase